jgi:hypothetical protein
MSAHVTLVAHTDGETHVWLPYAKWPACGNARSLPSQALSYLDARDVPLDGTCPVCIRALDERDH